MKKGKLLSIVIFCFVGTILVNGVVAVKPYSHVSYGDAMAGFISNGDYGILYRGLGIDNMFEKHWPDGPFPSPLVIAFKDKIFANFNPWWDLCVHDAHQIAVTATLYQMEIDFFGLSLEEFQALYDTVEIEFVLDDVLQDDIKTPLKPGMFDYYVFPEDYPIPGTDIVIPAGYVDVTVCWWSEGMVFKPDELAVGMHYLTTTIYGWAPLPIVWNIQFEILECWH